MGTLAKLSSTVVWTIGFVLCPFLDVSLIEYSTVSSGVGLVPSDHRSPPTDSPPVIRASASEPLDFSLSPPGQALSSTLTIAKADVAPVENVATPVPIQAQWGRDDATRFQQIMAEATTRSLHNQPMGDIVQAIAVQFLGASYRANLLDQSNRETLVVSLTQFDCVLFIETVLALAHSVALQDYSPPGFTQHLQAQRYRDGKLDGYCSRLHYFSEWLLDNQKRQQVSDMAMELGGIPLNKPLGFMSAHRHLYPRLVSDSSAYDCVRTMEVNLSPLLLRYVPQSQVRQIYSHLQPGDVIAITTDTPGLDVSHTGLAYRNADGSIGLIHAVPDIGVMISPDLQTYVNRLPGAIGILVARPTDPRPVMSGS